MSDIEEMIEQAARRGAEAALAAHRPRYGLTYTEVGEMLGCSERQVRRMVAEGHLELVPLTKARVALGSVLRLVGLDEQPVPVLASVVDLRSGTGS